MSTQRDVFVTAVLAFAGGLVTGLLVAPHSGKKLREMISARVHHEMKRVEGKLHDVEDKVVDLEQRVVAASQDVSERVLEATKQAVDQVVPTMPDDPEAWGMAQKDVPASLRKMPSS